MEKRKYIYPHTEVYVLNTYALMKTGESSPDLPPDPGTKPDLLPKGKKVF